MEKRIEKSKKIIFAIFSKIFFEIGKFSAEEFLFKNIFYHKYFWIISFRIFKCHAQIIVSKTSKPTEDHEAKSVRNV